VDWQTITLNWGFNYAFWASVVIGLGLTYWTYTRPPKPRLHYHMRHSTIISASDPAYSAHIMVTYKGAEIPRATLSQVSIWNDGNLALRRADITAKKPLVLSVPPGQHILQCSVTYMANEAMDATLGDGDASVLSFEYIDAGQGLICDVLHTGSDSDLNFEGVLISASPPVQDTLPSQTLPNRLAIGILTAGVAGPLIVMKVLLSQPGPSWSPLVQVFSIAAFSIGAIGWMIGLFVLAMKRSEKRINFGKPHH
jgi:hypothetical protein